MKRKSIFLTFAFAFCATIALQAGDYVMLSPLDTAALPAIPIKDYGGNLVRDALDKDAIWQGTQRQLTRHHFSNEIVYKTMVKLYRNTHKHYVTFPVAYWSTDPQGDSLLVSGRVYLPKRRYLNGIVIANHYTMTSDVEVPSNMLSMESVFTMKGYAVIMPDYVGYGLSRDEVHPYLHWRSAAQTAVDLLRNVPALLDYYGYSYPMDVIISGYSQGGAVALGVARMIEEMGEKAMWKDDEIDWTVRKLYAGAHSCISWLLAAYASGNGDLPCLYGECMAALSKMRGRQLCGDPRRMHRDRADGYPKEDQGCIYSK